MQLPPPEYVTDTLTGAVYDLPGGTTLVLGAVPDALATFTPHLSGTIYTRYGIPLSYPQLDVVIPGLFVGERGGILTGREGWEFIRAKFQMFPRADVIGLRSDGSPVQVFLRELDFGAPTRVFVYRAADDTEPVAELKALIAGADAGELPEMLVKYLPTGDLAALLATPE